MKFLFLLTALLLLEISNAQTSDFIHVDQFGYSIEANKVAVLSDPIVGYNSALTYTPPLELKVKNNETDATVFTGPIVAWNGGATHDQSGDRGWWFDFSELLIPGTYYLHDELNDERSAVFEISEDPYAIVLKQAGRMFYYNRCNSSKEAPYAEDNWTDGINFLNPLQDANCRYVLNPENELLEKDLSGGWFDAGDYNKYFSFAARTINDLLSAYEMNPSAFNLDWNIPESGDEIPDVLDEVKWELDWMIKMVNPDGSAHLKLGSTSYEENISSPPSANSDPRYYGPTCTSASTSAAFIFSRAALIYREFPALSDFADQLEMLAITCYDFGKVAYLVGGLETNCDDGTILAGDADLTYEDQVKQLIAASIYLYKLTGEDVYDDFIVERYNEVDPIASGNWNYYNVYMADALLYYVAMEEGDETTQEAILNSANLDASNNYESYYGFSAIDLYRGYMPSYSYHWGSNLPKAATGNLNLKYMLESVATDSLAYYNKAAELLHNFHGVNPIGIVYLSNMYAFGGDKCVNEIYHSWFWDGTEYDHALSSPKGPAPGFLSGGPNRTYEDPAISPPYGQPEQKSYLDFNDDWPVISYSISEPAIYYQAAYLRLLSYFVKGISEEPGTIVETASNGNTTVSVFPNPAKSHIQVTGITQLFNYVIYNTKGESVMHGQNFSSNSTINISALSNGFYYIKISTKNQEDIIKKFVKE